MTRGPGLRRRVDNYKADYLRCDLRVRDRLCRLYGPLCRSGPRAGHGLADVSQHRGRAIQRPKTRTLCAYVRHVRLCSSKGVGCSALVAGKIEGRISSWIHGWFRLSGCLLWVHDLDHRRSGDGGRCPGVFGHGERQSQSWLDAIGSLERSGSYPDHAGSCCGQSAFWAGGD